MCTERKATGEYVLACFMFATMRDFSYLSWYSNMHPDWLIGERESDIIWLAVKQVLKNDGAYREYTCFLLYSCITANMVRVHMLVMRNLLNLLTIV